MPAVIVDRLAALLARATASLEQEPVVPVLLRQLNVQLDEIHGGGMEVGTELLAATLRKLSSEGVDSFDAGDDLVMCNGFLQEHPLLEGQSPCMRASVREPLLRRWQACLQDDMLGLLIWRAACMAYFIVEEREAAQQLRQFLRAGRDRIRALDRKPAWLVFFLGHPDLFDERPGRELARQWFEGSLTLVDAIQDYAAIPESSWLWGEMVGEILRKTETMGSAAFARHVRDLLELSRLYQRHRDRIYAAMIENYVRFADKEVPQPLIDAVIDGWGNPQMERVDAAHRWSNVSEKARVWMCQLLAEKDLADFFELISKGSRTGLSAMDMRRLQFWKRYTPHMVYTRMILGDSFHNNRNGSIRTFVENRKKRLGLLVGDPENAAFLIRIGGYWFVEFSKTGNEFYSYAQEGIPFDPYARSIRTASMKLRPLADEWIAHNGAWEEKLGGYVDQVIGGKKPRVVVQRGRLDATAIPWETPPQPSPPRFPGRRADAKGAEAREPGLKSTLALLSTAAQQELRGIFLREVDYRKRNGAFWIELINPPSNDLISEMKQQGFSYKPGRGFYQ